MIKSTTVDEQIDILLSRGLQISNTKFAKEKLQNINYYNIINAYKNPFLKSSDLFKKDVTFNELYSVYVFDNELRNLFLKYVLILENELKSHIAYEFANYESDCVKKISSYGERSRYDYTTKKKQLASNKIIEKIDEKVIKKGSNEMIKHYKAKGTIPIWVIVNILSFGETRVLYSNLNSNLQNKISKCYENLTTKQLNSILSVVNMYRNEAAHGHRFFCFKICDVDKQIPDLNIHSNLELKKCKQYTLLHGKKSRIKTYEHGKNDLFSLVICFKYLLSTENFNKFYGELLNVISLFKKNIHSIEAKVFFDHMGFSLSIKHGEEQWKMVLKAKK